MLKALYQTSQTKFCLVKKLIGFKFTKHAHYPGVLLISSKRKVKISSNLLL